MRRRICTAIFCFTGPADNLFCTFSICYPIIVMITIQVRNTLDLHFFFGCISIIQYFVEQGLFDGWKLLYVWE